MTVPAELARRLTAAGQRAADWPRRRDELVLEAIDAGGTQREVAKLAGLSQAAVHDIVHRLREERRRSRAADASD